MRFFTSEWKIDWEVSWWIDILFHSASHEPWDQAHDDELLPLKKGAPVDSFRRNRFGGTKTKRPSVVSSDADNFLLPKSKPPASPLLNCNSAVFFSPHFFLKALETSINWPGLVDSLTWTPSGYCGFAGGKPPKIESGNWRLAEFMKVYTILSIVYGHMLKYIETNIHFLIMIYIT